MARQTRGVFNRGYVYSLCECLLFKCSLLPFVDLDEIGYNGNTEMLQQKLGLLRYLNCCTVLPFHGYTHIFDKACDLAGGRCF